MNVEVVFVEIYQAAGDLDRFRDKKLRLGPSFSCLELDRLVISGGSPQFWNGRCSDKTFFISMLHGRKFDELCTAEYSF
jgi:hypothetical protein